MMLVCRRVRVTWPRVPPPAMAPSPSACRFNVAPAALHGYVPMWLCGQVITRSITVTSSVSFGLLDGLPLSDNHASYGVYRVAWTEAEGTANTQGRWAVFSQVAKSERASQIKLGWLSDERGSLLGTFSDLQDAIEVANKFRELTRDDQKIAMKHLYNSEADELLRLGVWRATVGIDAPTPMEFEENELTHSQREKIYLSREIVRERSGRKAVSNPDPVGDKRRRNKAWRQEQRMRDSGSKPVPARGTPNTAEVDQTGRYRGRKADEEKAGKDEEETGAGGGWFS
eukprot:COSAG02_NODE_3129_length_7312_cov_338.294191_8_plen_285_part_00